MFKLTTLAVLGCAMSAKITHKKATPALAHKTNLSQVLHKKALAQRKKTKLAQSPIGKHVKFSQKKAKALATLKSKAKEEPLCPELEWVAPLDTDNSGDVTWAEAEAWLKSEGWDQEEMKWARQEFDNADADGNGAVNA